MIAPKNYEIGGIKVNNVNTLLSLLRGRRNLRMLNIFGNRRRNNGNMILWSLLGLTAAGVIGTRNTRWMSRIQEGFNNFRNNTRMPLQNQMNLANEFAEEFAPKINNQTNKFNQQNNNSQNNQK